jgi:hypothetical protein
MSLFADLANRWSLTMATVTLAGIDKPVQLVSLIDPVSGSLGGSSSSATVTAVASGIASVTIKAANTARKGITVTNTDANILYLKVGGGTASATDFSVAVAATTGYWEAPYGFTGAITGIWALDATGSALVTEYT